MQKYKCFVTEIPVRRVDSAQLYTVADCTYLYATLQRVITKLCRSCLANNDSGITNDSQKVIFTFIK